MIDDAKRNEIKDKVEAAQKRNAERSLGEKARDAASGVSAFAKEHPFATVAGGLAVGVLLASFLPGGRKVRRKASARSAALAAAISDFAITYGTQFLDEAGKATRAGQDRLSDLGDTIGHGASRAARGAGTLADSASDNARDIGRSALRTLKDLRSRVPH